MIQTLEGFNQIRRGLSYWTVRLNTGKTISELQADWHDDLATTGDTARIKEVALCTPAGEARIAIARPYTAFQFKCGVATLLTGERIMQAQIIGCVENEAGLCIAMIWDVVEQRLYSDILSNVHCFGPWRAGVAPIGELALDAMGVRL